MNDNPQKNAQGGQDDTNREQPKGAYQQQQGQEATQQSTQVPNGGTKLPPTASPQGGQDDTKREQPKGDYQQSS
jgi:hypothetical protein